MKAEYVAGNTSWSELSFEIFFCKSVETVFRNQFHFHQRYPLSLPKNVALKQDQLELYSFQFSHESHRKMHYLNAYFKDLCHVLWSCSLGIKCPHSSWGRENKGFPFSHPSKLQKFRRSFM